MPRIIIFANGELPEKEKARALIHADDAIVCADGGTRYALALGLKPSLIIGDLDSVTEVELTNAEAQIIRYPRDKNETDLELALDHTLAQNPTSVLVIAALGNRLDQTIANLGLLSHSRFSALDCRFDDGVEEVFFCRNHSTVQGGRGDRVSLIPWNGAVGGIRTFGLRWPLDNETLYPDKARGISNEMTDDTADIHIEAGLLLVVHHRI
jgi:thiamine pyrophosphokinase